MVGERHGGFPLALRRARTPSDASSSHRLDPVPPTTPSDPAGPPAHVNGTATRGAGAATPTSAGAEADTWAASDDVLTLEGLLAERGEALMRLAYLVTGHRADAEDLFQETLADAHRKWHLVQASDHPYAYVRTMLTNRHTSSRRRKWHGERPTDPGELPDRGLADPARRVDSDAALWQLLEQLPDRMRTVLVLRYFEDLEDAEIARTLGIAVSTVRATASRALAQLRERGEPA